MANETSYATLLSNGGRVARVLEPVLHEILYSKVGLRALMDFRDFRGGGSATMNVTKVTRGLKMTATSTEVSSGFSNSPLTTGNYDLTVARNGAILAPTDLMKITGGALDVGYLLGILTESFELTLTDKLVGLFANIAGNVGTSGSDLTVDNIYAGKFYLNLQDNSGRVACVLHNQQINDLESSLRAEAAGALTERADAQAMVGMAIGAASNGYKGSFAGVDFYQSSDCPTANAGADREGCMFAQGAFASTIAPVSDMDPMVDPDDIVLATPLMFIERNRDSINAITQFIVNCYIGVAEQEDLRACRVTTDA